MTNDPIAALERAVADLAAFATEHPGEVESEIPRIWQAKNALLNTIHQVQETCAAARTEARFKATMRRLETVS